MKKRVLSFILTICLVAGLMPGTAFAVSDNVARINSTEYPTLQAAVGAVSEGETIQFIRDFSLTSTVTIDGTNHNSFILDLNGRTLNSSNMVVLLHNGSGTLTIRDSLREGGGKITGTKRNHLSGIIHLNGGSIIIESGEVENTGKKGNENAIYVSSGSVTVSGGTVKSVSMASSPILNYGPGSVNVTAGMVETLDVNSYAIRSFGTGSVAVTGGTVRNPNGMGIEQVHAGDITVTGGRVEGKRQAVYIHGTGKITISGTAEIISNDQNYAVGCRVSAAVLEITGGTVENTHVSGTAIYRGDPDGTISIPSGSAIIKGGGMAMNKAPDLSGYTNVLITASTDVSGDPTVAYDAGSITTYKYLKFEPGSVTAPSAPTIGTATAGNGQATISFTAPDSDGGAEITNYTVISSPGGITRTGASSPVTLTGLTNGTAYTFTVTATNSEGTGAASAASNSVTPTVPSSGGSGSSTPSLITKIDTGGSVTGTNVDRLVKEGKSLTVEGKAGEKIEFDTEALKNIDGQTKDSIKVEIKDVSSDYKKEHPDRLVVSLSITAGNKHITSFGNGIATISLPYELKAGEKAEDVMVWYLAEDGNMTEVPCTYDATTKLATFKVNHFSLYVVGTADTSKWTNPFSDVKESSWFYEAVRFVSANKLMQGTTDTAFDTKGKTTRGMIVTTLWRMENEPKASKEMTFTDVKNGKYYHDAVAWASEKGIVGGYSVDQFGPEDSITREQLAVILHNYAASKGYKTSTAGDLSAFSDAGAIHKWGKEAMVWANGEGLINGTGNNLLDPAGTAERGQVATILQRLIDNTIQ